MSASRPRVALLSAAAYIAVMGAGMTWIRAQGITYGEFAMFDVFWVILIGLNLMNAWVVMRWFGWAEVGFRPLQVRQLVWLAPLALLLAVKWAICLQGIAARPLDAAGWQKFAFVGFVTLLVGLGEEVAFRGILLHAFARPGHLLRGMLISALGFSLLHSVNALGGQSIPATAFQLVYTFLFGCLFAPLMLRLNSIWPLILVHWLWDFVQFGTTITGNMEIIRYDLLQFPIMVLVGGALWFVIGREERQARRAAA